MDYYMQNIKIVPSSNTTSYFINVSKRFMDYYIQNIKIVPSSNTNEVSCSTYGDVN